MAFIKRECLFWKIVLFVKSIVRNDDKLIIPTD